MVECARRYRQPPEACQPRDCESRILLPIARARGAPCVGPSDPYSGTTNKVGDLGLWWGCTKELWAWPHPWGVAGAKIETAWGYSPGEGVCTRSHMAHAGHTLTGPKPNNWISIFFWPTFDRWPSFVRLSRGCFPNNEGIAMVTLRKPSVFTSFCVPS